MAQLRKNYSPSNIYNLIVKRSLFLCQNTKVQIIQRLLCITKSNKQCCLSFYFSFYKQKQLSKGEKIFYLVFIVMEMSNLFGSAFYM